MSEVRVDHVCDVHNAHCMFRTKRGHVPINLSRMNRKTWDALTTETPVKPLCLALRPVGPRCVRRRRRPKRVLS